MPDQPLSPFPTTSSPFALFEKFGLTGELAGAAIFGIVVLAWALFSIVAIYHWIRYSHAALIAIPLILGYLVGSAILIVFAASGFL